MIWRQKINQGMEAVEKAREQGGKYTYDADRAFSEAFEIARNMKDCEGMVSAGLGFNSLADLQGGAYTHKADRVFFEARSLTNF